MGPGNKPIKPGKFNIGITAGVETTLCPAHFIEGCNRMDLVITTSKHSRDTIVNTVFDRINNNTNKKEGTLSCTTPVEILFEGLDLDTYIKTDKLDKSIVDELSTIKESFCYLFVGHWIKGSMGQDRKDVGMMIKTFCETFKNVSQRNKPALVLKTSGAQFCIMDRDECLNKIHSILQPYGDKAPNVYLLHGDLSDDEMNSLYNHPKMKTMISFTKGEGFGRPLMEFGITGKPIIASNWSGHLDFLHPDHCTLLPGQLTQVHPSAADEFLLKESQWFTVNYQYASDVLKDINKNYKSYLEKSRKQPQYIKTTFSMDKMTEKFSEILDTKVAQPVSITLPNLNVKTKSAPKLKLPKLKKVDV